MNKKTFYIIGYSIVIGIFVFGCTTQQQPVATSPILTTTQIPTPTAKQIPTPTNKPPEISSVSIEPSDLRMVTALQ